MVRVVIVGGQFSGRRVRSLLLAGLHPLDVVIVESKHYFEYTPAVLRCLVEPRHAHSIIVPNANGVLVSYALDIKLAPGSTSGHLTLEDGTQVPFDFLVLCTGSGYAAPIKPSLSGPPDSKGSQGPRDAGAAQSAYARIAELEAAAKALASAASILVVGGGAVGVELAAEVLGRYPKVQVTIVSSQARLLNSMPPKAGTYAERWLKARGAQVLLSTRIAEWPQGDTGVQSVITTYGQTLSADLAYNCVGVTALGNHLFQSLRQQPDAGSAADQEPSAAHQWQGFPVNPNLQVLGFNNIFACGDAAHLPAALHKTAYTADLTAAIVAKNIIRAVRRQSLLCYPQDLPRLMPVTRPPAVYAISLHKYDGILQFNQLVLTGFLAAANKWFIEFVQLQIARESWLWLRLWLLVETVMTCLGSIAFTSHNAGHAV